MSRFPFSVLILLSALLLGACRTTDSHPAPPPMVENILRLPRLPEEQPEPVDLERAKLLTGIYFNTYVTCCGLPQAPVDAGEYWTSRLFGGFTGFGEYGTLWIRKSDGAIWLQPPADQPYQAQTLYVIEQVKQEKQAE